MSSRIKVSQWGGIAFVIGNLFFLANKLNEMSLNFLGRPMPDVIEGSDILLIIIGQVALIAGFVAFFQVYSGKLSRGGKIAMGLISGGGVVLAIGHIAFMPGMPDMLFLLVGFGLLALVIGLIWFGILTLRQPIMARWRWLPLFTGIMGTIGFVVLGGSEARSGFLVFRTLFALGLIAMGIVLWMEKPAQKAVVRTADG